MGKETLLEKLKELLETRKATNIGLAVIAVLLLVLVLKSFPGGFIIEALIVFGVIVIFYRLYKQKN